MRAIKLKLKSEHISRIIKTLTDNEKGIDFEIIKQIENQTSIRRKVIRIRNPRSNNNKPVRTKFNGEKKYPQKSEFIYHAF